MAGSKSVFPNFLRPEMAPSRVTENGRDHKVVAEAYSRYEKKLAEEAAALTRIEQELQDRMLRSDLAFRRKDLQQKRAQLEMNSFLVAQVQDKRERETQDMQVR